MVFKLTPLDGKRGNRGVLYLKLENTWKRPSENVVMKEDTEQQQESQE